MRRDMFSVRQVLTQPAGSKVTVNGWVRSRSQSKGQSFVELNDGSSFKNLNIVIDGGVLSPENDGVLTIGSCIRATGDLVALPAPDQPVELHASEMHIYGTADPVSYPLQKNGHTLEVQRGIPPQLTPRTRISGAAYHIRNALSFAIHRFFQERNFLYIHPPIITALNPQGTGSMFGVTTLDLMNLPRTSEGKVDFSQDFFGEPTYLTNSGQLEAEVFALAFSQVYSFGPTFHVEQSNTPQPIAESWMIEPEMAFLDLNDTCTLAEEFIKFLLQYIIANCSDELAFLDQHVESGLINTLRYLLEVPFEHITYTEAVNLLETPGEMFQIPVFWGIDLQTEHKRYLTDQIFKKPIIVTDHPPKTRAFYLRENDDEKTVRSMDMLVQGFGELIKGGQREERHDVLRRRIQEEGLDEKKYQWYLELRKYGSAPHSGFGMGFEPMLSLLTGLKDIYGFFRFPTHTWQPVDVG